MLLTRRTVAAAPDPTLAACRRALIAWRDFQHTMEATDEGSPKYVAAETAHYQAAAALDAMTPTSVEGLIALIEYTAACYGAPEEYSGDVWADLVAQMRRGLEQMTDRR